jgi:septal ring factor EnvC (AmiA/AmiB activator)
VGSKDKKKKHSKQKASKQKDSKQVAASQRVGLDVELRVTEARISAMHTRIDRTVAVLDDATARLAAIVALLDGLPTSGASSDATRELRQRLEQMLVAQRRTNELLDLALGVAIEGEHGGRPGG